MPRKQTRRRAPGPPRFRWTKGDSIKFVACLDFSLQHQVDLNTTAICHLKKRIGREVTAKQVERVLRKEYKTYGRDGDHYVFDDFLSEGSSFLDGYADIDREHIRDEVRLIETPRYLLRSTSLVSQSHSRTQSLDPRHQRSASSNGHNSPHAAADLEVLDGLRAQAGNSGKNQTHGQQVLRAGNLNWDGNSGQSPPEARARAKPRSADVKREPAPPPLAGVSDAPLPTCSSTRTANGAAIKALEQELAAKDEQMQRVMLQNTEQKHYIFSLSNRLSVAEFECEKIRESASRAAECSDEIIVRRDLLYENSVLKGALQRLNSQQKIIPMIAADSVRPSNQEIWQELGLIAADIKDACSSADMSIPSKPIDDMEPSRAKLESWTRRVARCSLDRFLASPADSDISDLDIVRALAAAGISELVFQTQFPDFLATESPLLDQYRRHILTKDGPQALYQLDLLACNSIISEAYHASRIFQDATAAASSVFCTTMAPFVPAQDATTSNTAPSTQFPSPTDGEGQGAACQPRIPMSDFFSETFIRALTLKQSLVLSRTKYQLVFFRPGDRFDPEIMLRDGEGYNAFNTRSPRQKRDGWPRPRPVADGTCIKLCLFPALYARGENGLETQDRDLGVTVRECLVECDNFVRDCPDIPGEGFALVFKGIVLV